MCVDVVCVGWGVYVGSGWDLAIFFIGTPSKCVLMLCVGCVCKCVVGVWSVCKCCVCVCVCVCVCGCVCVCV